MQHPVKFKIFMPILNIVKVSIVKGVKFNGIKKWYDNKN